jgi:hypothetical protein
MTKQEFADLAERVLWTAAQAFLAVFVVADVSTAKAAGVAAAAAAVAVVKGFVAQKVGAKGTAATLPSSLDSGF